MNNYVMLSITAILMVAVIAFKTSSVDFKIDSKNGIQFSKESYSNVLLQSKDQHKLAFIDVYATWCGPCKLLKRRTFSDAEVGTFYNQNFINIAVDGEQEEGRMLVKKYAISAYPALLFVDETGKVVAQTYGYFSPKDFLELGKKVQNRTK